MTKPRHSNPGFMAKVLAETVADLSNPAACRHHLKFAGFPPKTIDKHMTNARNMAKHLRINEIELRVRKERV